MGLITDPDLGQDISSAAVAAVVHTAAPSFDNMEHNMEHNLGNDMDADDSELAADEAPNEGFAPVNIPVAMKRTISSRAYHDPRAAIDPDPLVRACREIVQELHARHLDLTTFLYYVTGWTLDATVEDAELRHARTGLMLSDELRDLLRAWYRPPRRHGAGVRTKAAKDTLDSFSVGVVKEIVNAEMRAVAPILIVPADQLSEESLIFDIDAAATQIKAAAPTLFSLLRSACFTTLQERRNKVKNPDPVRTIAAS